MWWRWRRSASPMPWPRWAPPARPSTCRSCSASPTRWSSASTATRPGSRAAGRALEATLPHATDLRSARFLFLPSEHDPDSYVREFGPAAFEDLVAKAVPLSRQLIEHASQGAQMGSAEGRARMLAQAKPLWQALPDGALRRQLLPELARQAQLESADLAALWGHAAAPARPWQGALRAPARHPGRRAPAGLADQALRLLLRHNDWWERLVGRRPRPAARTGRHAWRGHGLAGTPAHRARRTALGHAGCGHDRRALGRHRARLAQVRGGGRRTRLRRPAARALPHVDRGSRSEDAHALASGQPDSAALLRLRELRERIAALKTALAGRSGRAGLSVACDAAGYNPILHRRGKRDGSTSGPRPPSTRVQTQATFTRKGCPCQALPTA